MRAKSVFFSGRWVFVIVLGKGRSPFGSIKANFWPLTENGGVFSSSLVALRAFAHLYLVATLVVCNLAMCFLKARQISMDNQEYRK